MATTTAPATTSDYSVPLRETLENAGFTVNWQGANQPITVSNSQGQSYSFSPSDYQLQNGSAYTSQSAINSMMQGMGESPVRSTLGSDYGLNYEAGNVDVTNPTTGQTASVTPDYNIGGTTYDTPAVLQSVQSRLTPAYQSVYTQQLAQIPQYIQQQQALATSTYNQMNTYAQQMGSAGQAMLQAYQTQYSQALGTLQTMIAQDQNQSVPQSVQVSIAQMKQDLDDNIAQTRNQMAQDGTLTSGAAAYIEQKMQTGALTNEESALASWFAQQQNQVFQGTLQLASTQMQGATEEANLYQQAYTAPIQQEATNLQAYNTQESGINQQQYSLTSQLNQWYAQQQQTAQATSQANLLKQYQLELQNQWKQMPYNQTTAYQGQEITDAQERLTQALNTASGKSSKPTTAQLSNQAYSSAYNIVAQEYQSGMSIADITADIYNNAAALEAEGVNPADIVTYAINLNNARLAAEEQNQAPATPTASDSPFQGVF
jgi:hypothetical protein